MEIWRKLTDVHPTVTEFQNGLATIHMLIAGLQDVTKALESQRRAAAIWQKLIDAHPTVTRFRRNLAGVPHNMAGILNSQGRKTEALALFEQARSNSEAAVRADGKVVQYQYFFLGESPLCHWRTRRRGPASWPRHSSPSGGSWRPGRNSPPTTPLFPVSSSRWRIATTKSDFWKRRWESQPRRWRRTSRACAIDERLTREHPESPDFASGLAGALSNMADLDIGAKRFKEARTRLFQAIALQKKAPAAAPRHPTCRAFLTEHLDLLIKADKELGRAKRGRRSPGRLAGLEGGRSGSRRIGCPAVCIAQFGIKLRDHRSSKENGRFFTGVADRLVVEMRGIDHAERAEENQPPIPVELAGTTTCIQEGPMTESEWLSSSESYEMLAFIPDKASERQLRLFSVACCRRIWEHIADERSRRAVDVAELDIDGGIGAEERVSAARSAADALAQAYASLDNRVNGHHYHAAWAAALCSYTPEVPLRTPIDSPKISGTLDLRHDGRGQQCICKFHLGRS